MIPILSEILNSFGKDEGYSIQNFGDYGTLFTYKKHKQCILGKAKQKVQNQYIYLQMLVESGFAEPIREGFLFNDNSNICAFDDIARSLFNLPKSWQGGIDLNAKGSTFKDDDFTFELTLVRENGQKVRNYNLNGPFLELSNFERYLPTKDQYKVLDEVEKHSKLLKSQKTEENNLNAIINIQLAKENINNFSFHHFNNIKVEDPSDVSIAVSLKPNGGLHVSPDFGLDGIDIEELESRILQLNPKSDVCIRIKNKNGSKIIRFNEKILQAIQEILNKSEIAPEDRDSFLKAPAAFLNNYLINLDDGFSLRVTGSEIFKKAYFGEDDSHHIGWLGSTKEDIIVPLENLSSFIHNIETAEIVCENAKNASLEGKNFFEFDGITVIIPQDKETLTDICNKLIKEVNDNINKINNKSLSPQTIESEKSYISIKLNDDETFASNDIVYNSNYYWQGPLLYDEIKLKPFAYQEDGIRWLIGHAMHAIKSENAIDGALLADDMGLGKTFMTLVGLNAWQNILAKEKRDNNKDFIYKPILVVAPVVLLENWKEEVKKVFKISPFSEIVILQGAADLKRFRTNAGYDTLHVRGLKVGSNYGSNRLDGPKKLVLVSYDELRRYPFSLSAVDWATVVFDESQAIKNPNAQCSRAAKALKGDFKLAVTGTPVENNLIDFWNIFDTVKPCFLDSCQNFRKKYILPITKLEETRYGVGLKLRKFVSHYMLRRNKEDFLSDLPRKNVYVGGIVDSINLSPEMEGYQLAIYNKIINMVLIKKKAGQNIRGILLPSLQKMRAASLHPYLVDSITHDLPTNKKQAYDFISLSQKLVSILKILENIHKRNEKVIIFLINRQLQLYLSIAIRIIFDLKKVDIINGETSAVSSSSQNTRKQIIEDFQKQNGFGVIIMSPLAVGVGLTIVGVNNVIHLERHWNPAKEAQATDRVYRIGQKKDVNVYIPILTHPNRLSFDENLAQLLYIKVDLKEAVVTPIDVTPEDFDSKGLFGL